MSFFTEVKADAVQLEQDVVAGLKTGLAYVDNVVVTEIDPALEDAFLAALKILGQDALAALLKTNTPA